MTNLTSVVRNIPYRELLSDISYLNKINDYLAPKLRECEFGSPPDWNDTPLTKYAIKPLHLSGDFNTYYPRVYHPFQYPLALSMQRIITGCNLSSSEVRTITDKENIYSKIVDFPRRLLSPKQLAEIRLKFRTTKFPRTSEDYRPNYFQKYFLWQSILKPGEDLVDSLVALSNLSLKNKNGVRTIVTDTTENILYNDLTFLVCNAIVTNTAILSNPINEEVKLVRDHPLIYKVDINTNLIDGHTLPITLNEYNSCDGFILTEDESSKLYNNPYALPKRRRALWDYLLEDDNLTDEYINKKYANFNRLNRCQSKHVIDHFMGIYLIKRKGLRLLCFGVDDWNDRSDLREFSFGKSGQYYFGYHSIYGPIIKPSIVGVIAEQNRFQNDNFNTRS